jgi:hypothetical protein
LLPFNPKGWVGNSESPSAFLNLRRINAVKVENVPAALDVGGYIGLASCLSGFVEFLNFFRDDKAFVYMLCGNNVAINSDLDTQAFARFGFSVDGERDFDDGLRRRAPRGHSGGEQENGDREGRSSHPQDFTPHGRGNQE